MSLPFSITSATLKSGDVIPFSSDALTVVLGPNNCGKTTLLRDIETRIKGGPRVEPALLMCRTVETSRAKEFGDFVRSKTREFVTNGNIFLRGYLTNIYAPHAKAYIDSSDSELGDLTPLVCRFIDTKARLTTVDPPKAIDLLHDVLAHPIHALQNDDGLEQRFSDYCKLAFGGDLIVNHGAGSKVPLHFGTRPVPAAGEDRLSKSYKDALRALPQVDEQGDGIKSFVGTLLACEAVPAPLTLLDEPEAFLHPPQARLIGTILGKNHKDRQLIIATHSGDVLRGLLDSNAPTLTVVRLTRNGTSTTATRLEPSDITRVWADPILRFSNVLDGLFHEGVVICEADGDCRFYSAVRGAVADTAGISRQPDVMFTATGGKDRIPVVAAALKKLGVPTRVIADFDTLSDAAKMKQIVVALNGNWATVEHDYATVKKDIDSKGPPLSTSQVVDGIRKVLDSVPLTDPFPETAQDEIRATMKASSAWSFAKKSGKEAVSAGQPTQALERLLKALRKIGLCIVPVGQLESFDKTIGLHGPRWVAKVLEKDLGSAPELQNARAFVSEASQFSA